MKYYQFNTNIDDDTAKKLFDFLNAEADKKTIILNSSGGNIQLTRTIVHILNQFQPGEITLIGCCGLYSAAFHWFRDFTGKKLLTRACRGMYHYGSMEVNLVERSKGTWHEDEERIKMIKTERLFCLAYAKEFMNEKELRRFKKNDDVYFTHERMKEIFPDVPVI